MILSIDIGLRNLAFCCMSAENKKDLTSYKIELWNLYNTLDSDDYHCESIQKNGKVCGSKCGFKYVTEVTGDVTEVTGDVTEVSSSGVTEVTGDVTKTITYCCKTHFPKNTPKTSQNIFKKKMIGDYLLQDIAKTLLSKIQDIFDENTSILSNVTKVLIELQPKMNRKAIFTSHLLYGKLTEIYRNTDTTIKFVRASQKLKAYTGPEIQCHLKGAYAQRKWLSVQYAKWFLENKFSQEQKEKWLPYLNSCTKADDVCDGILMSINGLFGVPKTKIKLHCHPL